MILPADDIRNFLIDQVDDHPKDIVALTAAKFGVTRQAVHRHMAKLVKEGVVKATGTTRSRSYSLARDGYFKTIPLEPGLEEDRVWRTEIEPRLVGLPENVTKICHYGFTEILNNAIDHSEGSNVEIAVVRTVNTVDLWIDDDGVGIFEKIKRKFNLEDHRHAILELSKGKLTSDPARHSGQGIFFTSRMFDYFSITSSRLIFSHVHGMIDFLMETPGTKITSSGTKVFMKISSKSILTPKQIFDEYTDLESDDLDFSKTHVALDLARYGKEDLVSRSQAKRVLAGLDRFKDVVLDFAGLDTIGQAFADEIFRVYARQHPEIHLTPINATEDVNRMIRRAVSARKAELDAKGKNPLEE